MKTAINKFSKKRSKQNRQYLKARQTFLEKRNECEAGLKGCTGDATTIHHQRGRIGDNLLNEKYWLPCCFSCHEIIEHEPVMAKELGLSVNRLNIISPAT